MMRVVSPLAGQAVKGIAPLSVFIEENAPVESVEYRINGRPVSGRLPAPFRFEWQSASYWDGPQSVEAVGRDAEGAVIASAPVSPFLIANSGASIRVTSPDLTETLRGTVNLRVEIGGAGGAPAAVDGTMVYVDGRRIGTAFSANPAAPVVVTVPLDTTKFLNGEHELFIGAHASDTKRPMAMIQTRLRFDNGGAASALRSNWREVFLVPGESASLTARVVDCDGDESEASGVTLSSSDSAVAVVSDGNVKAVKPGVATVMLSAKGLSTTARVVVHAERQFPHFSRDGEILTAYDADRSVFVRSMFYLEPKLVEQIEGLADHLREAAVNALESGFYLNIHDLGNPTDLDGFRKVWDPYWGRLATSAKKLGFGLVLNGDNMARSPADLLNSINLPWSAGAIAHTFATMRDSKMVMAIEMMDESSLIWGDTPRPSDRRWAKFTPPVPDDAFARLMERINATPGRPPVSWPILWLSGPQAAANWMGDAAFSDYASNYWDSNDWRPLYPYGQSLTQTREGMENVVAARYHLMQRDRPAIQLMSVAGPFYTKLGPGDQYTPGQDRLQAAGVRPEAVTSHVMYALANGQAGVRAYAYDWQGWKDDRGKGAYGASDRQTGAEPYSVGVDRWQSMASAFRAVRALEPWILQPRINAADLGDFIVTGARQGPRGRLFMAINFSEMTFRTRADLSPYLYPDASRMVRLRLRGAEFSSEMRDAAGHESVALQPGECIIWLFPPDDSAPEVASRLTAAVSRRKQ